MGRPERGRFLFFLNKEVPQPAGLLVAENATGHRFIYH
jgi:hypothetical protein